MNRLEEARLHPMENLFPACRARKERLEKLYDIWITFAEDEQNDIQRLAALAGVSPRLIRYDYLPMLRFMREMENEEVEE